MEVNNSTQSLEDLLYFKVEDVKLTDLHDLSTTENSEANQNAGIPSHRMQIFRPNGHGKLVRAKPATSLNSSLPKRCGSKVDVNLFEVALFRLGDKVYAIQEKCPHAGGPLHIGDLEDLGRGQPCVTCPYHGWKFNLKTGARVYPRPKDNAAEVYPVKIDPQDGTLWVGFKSFNQKYFKEPSW